MAKAAIPSPSLLEEHLACNIMSEATPWKRTPVGKRHGRRLACPIGNEGGWGGGKQPQPGRGWYHVRKRGPRSSATNGISNQARYGEP